MKHRNENGRNPFLTKNSFFLTNATSPKQKGRQRFRTERLSSRPLT